MIKNTSNDHFKRNKVPQNSPLTHGFNSIKMSLCNSFFRKDWASDKKIYFT